MKKLLSILIVLLLLSGCSTGAPTSDVEQNQGLEESAEPVERVYNPGTYKSDLFEGEEYSMYVSIELTEEYIIDIFAYNEDDLSYTLLDLPVRDIVDPLISEIKDWQSLDVVKEAEESNITEIFVEAVKDALRKSGASEELINIEPLEVRRTEVEDPMGVFIRNEDGDYLIVRDWEETDGITSTFEQFCVSIFYIENNVSSIKIDTFMEFAPEIYRQYLEFGTFSKEFKPFLDEETYSQEVIDKAIEELAHVRNLEESIQIATEIEAEYEASKTE